MNKIRKFLSGKLFVGLMGVTNDEIMVTPNGKNLVKLPFGLSWKVQNIQHKIAQLSWRIDSAITGVLYS